MADAGDHVAYAGRLRADDRPDDAADHYERALALDPDHADAHAEYAALLAGDEPGTAEHHYREALALAPDDPATRSDYGLLLYEADRLTDAREQLERAVELWLARDRRVDALRDLDVLVRIDHTLARPTAAAGRWRYAMDLLAEADVDPELDRGLRALGTVLTGRDVHERVRDAVALGIEHLGRGEFERAIHLFAPAWDEYDRLRAGSDARRDARRAGAALAGFHRVAGNAGEERALVDALGGSRDRLGAGPRAVYDELTGSEGRSPEGLRSLASDPDLRDGESASGSNAAERLFAFADLLELMRGA
jgi:tetratricopeptide (TPR) repeat protein